MYFCRTQNRPNVKNLFYIVKGFGLIKRGMRVKRKCNHFKCNQGFSSKAACHEKKKLTCHQGIIKLVNSLLSCLSCQNHFMFLNRGQHVDITDSLAEDEGELFFLFDTSSHKVFRKENHPFQEKCMDFHEIHPRVAYDLTHVCIS